MEFKCWRTWFMQTFKTNWFEYDFFVNFEWFLKVFLFKMPALGLIKKIFQNILMLKGWLIPNSYTIINA